MSLRLYRTHPILFYGIIFGILMLYYFHTLICTTYSLLSLNFNWPRDAPDFLISSNADRDAFDLSFANYSRTQDSAGPLYRDLVPPVLHHIALGGHKPQGKWIDARNACLELHPGWEAMLWTDENAGDFVRERFPELLNMWEQYGYLIQRIDALRYLVLYEYGGVVLDMDLKCTRSLGPLRRFSFVAPAAHPTGFSIGFMMASKRNEFVGKLVRSLKMYNRRWLGFPYPTVMFSTGCHYASTIHALQQNRSELRILAGPLDNFKLHSLNGPVSTPIFNHLGSSSWHSYDASLIVLLGKSAKWWIPLFILGAAAAVFFMVRRSKVKGTLRRYQSYRSILHGEKTSDTDLEGRIA
ncbi:hypothetical protein VC83_06086 [Pseudogymnoascus destructans]|uniref:Membrane-bound alpha-1,6-mannosyltransferase Initiation-specific n=2 Tax=Pseudogymnoascus destructans TaxID=655981 RepID=A0A177A9D9_9PEZI|nr:uncharacterized protein VC83_06086 [Pseudogymnoascus destructans]OAF58768.2 hypothetical protein VC83_06086 [Pseudogymnoascus destructans]